MSNFDINDLTIDEKIGQILMFGFDALEINDHAINMIKNYHVGNVILFTRNVKSVKQLFELNQNLQKLALSTIGIPLLISIDQEGGMVTRIKNEATFFPGAMTIATTKDVNMAYLSGKYMGEELVKLGINMNLAPSLDVNNNPLNPVIGVRSYSDNPKIVSDFGLKTIEGLQENVIATAKHFPGHGDTQVDSHLELPKIDFDKERLDRIELYPFKKAIKNGVKAIMSSHINFPAYTEDNLPTTLSKKCLTGLLRNELKFEGLIITDCMEMQAIQHNYTTELGALMAVNAGANLVCVSHTEELQIGAINRIKEALLSGDINEEIINERVARVLSYKESLDLSIIDNKLEDVIGDIGSEKHKTLAYNIVKSGGTIKKGKAFVKKDKTLLIAVTPTVTSIADEDDGYADIEDNVNKKLIGFDTVSISAKPSIEEINKCIDLGIKYEQVIVCNYNANIYTSQLVLINKLSKLKLELSIIAMRNPYDLLYTDSIENYVCFYEYTPNSINALIEYLKGDLILKEEMNSGMTEYIIGIDGGGTKTHGALFDLDGKIVKKVHFGYANFSVDEEISQGNIYKAIDELVDSMGKNEKLLHIELGVAGVSKIKNRNDYLDSIVYKYGASVDLVTDAEIALYSVKKDTDMKVIMVLGGTGSVIMINDKDNSSILGGFGHLLGDEGSSYHLAITALKNIINEFEGNLEFSDLSKAILKQIKAETHYDIKNFVYDGNKSSIAKLSLFIAELAIEGDLDAKKLFVDEGKHLARQTFTAFKKLNTKERILIGIKGGFLLNAPFVKETLIAELDKQKLDYEISKDEVDPVIGAYYLSLKKISVR